MTSVLPISVPPPVNSGGSATDPLAQLRDLHLPDPIGWWPLAPGWLLVGLVLLSMILLGCWCSWRAWRKWRSGRYRRLAVAELQCAFEDYSRTQNGVLFLQQLSQILRRAALLAFPT